jgi:hypothetical protein
MLFRYRIYFRFCCNLSFFSFAFFRSDWRSALVPYRKDFFFLLGLEGCLDSFCGEGSGLESVGVGIGFGFTLTFSRFVMSKSSITVTVVDFSVSSK